MTRGLAISPFQLSPAFAGRSVALVLEASRRATPMVLGALAPLFLPEEARLYLVDGVNAFDPYVFVREARRRGLREDVLDRVFVTRAFTIHQLAAVTAEMMPPVLRGEPGAVFGVLGLDHLFLEESLRGAERARVLRGIVADLECLRSAGARLLVTHEPPPAGQMWWKPMLDFGDIRCRALAEVNGEWKLERYPDGKNSADFQYLAPGGD